MNPFKRLKQRWQITRDIDFFLIMLVFSLAGASVGLSRRIIFNALKLNHAAWGIQLLVSLLLIVPLYQISTLVFGLFLGQFRFFWERQKALSKSLVKMTRRLLE